MISIAVSAQRTFTLAADLPTTTAYFRDVARTLEDLPHLSLVETHERDKYRILYSAAEAGVYHVALYCDIQVHVDEVSQTIRVTPLTGVPPVSPVMTVSSLTGQGYYSSQAVLQADGAHTNVRYDVQITAEIPKRRTLTLVPDQVVRRAIERVVDRRLQEITDAFALNARP